MNTEHLRVGTVVVPGLATNASSRWATDSSIYRREAKPYLFIEATAESVADAAPLGSRMRPSWEDLAFGTLALSGAAGIVSALVYAMG